MDKIGLSLEWSVNVDHVPILAGLSNGFFEDEGIDLQLVEPVNHEAGMELVAAGKLDFAITEPIHLPGAVAAGEDNSSAGLPIVAIGRYFETGFGILAKSETISSPKDLKGKTIAAPLGIYAPIIVKHMASSDGVKEEDLSDEDFNFTSVGYYLVDALVKGKADAAFAAFENYEMIEASMRGLKTKLLKFTDYGVPSYGYLVFVTHKQNTKEDRGKDIICRFLRSVSKSVEYTIKNKDEALSSFLQTVPVLDNELTRQSYPATLKCYRTDTSLQLEEWERLAEFANDAGLVGRNNNSSSRDRTKTGRRVTGKELIATTEDLN
jgi:ABC-type nitrate/sulfonate/bicarbonate transport system substrate-binding protein